MGQPAVRIVIEKKQKREGEVAMEREADLKRVQVRDEFWSARQKLIADKVIPYQEKILNDEIEGAAKSHALANFRIAAGLEEGDFYGMVFQDSDVAKWLEGVAYSLVDFPDPELEARADAVIDVIAKAQQEDGYLDTYFQIKEPDRKMTDLQECHELYCAGHMMEASAAYYMATGKDKLLQVMEKNADFFIKRLGTEEGKERGIPGHEEVELGLLRLYQATGKEKYLKQALYFVNERGQNPDYFKEETEKRGYVFWGPTEADPEYNQSHAPVRDQERAVGHSVRAVYLYTAMAELAAKTKDEELQKACERLWDNMTKKQMYLTAGIGQTAKWEGFTLDYDLPNDTAYAETCAAIGLMFFARRMLQLSPKGKYGDIMEQALYNGVLGGMQLDGERFFYVNPLEVNPGVSGKLPGYEHVVPQRPRWYACACCPPNVVRLVMSLGKYGWGEDTEANTAYAHLYLGGTADLDCAHITSESRWPWEGNVLYHIRPTRKENFTFAVRIPSYQKDAAVFAGTELLWKRSAGQEQCAEAKGLQCRMEDGYLYISGDWKEEQAIVIQAELPVRRMYANTAVRADAGCVALMRGPIVYTFEGIDHTNLLQELRIPRTAQFQTDFVPLDAEHGKIMEIRFTGKAVTSQGQELYSEMPPQISEVPMRAIPYYAWGNRGENQMRVWMLEA